MKVSLQDCESTRKQNLANFQQCLIFKNVQLNLNQLALFQNYPQGFSMILNISKDIIIEEQILRLSNQSNQSSLYKFSKKLQRINDIFISLKDYSILTIFKLSEKTIQQQIVYSLCQCCNRLSIISLMANKQLNQELYTLAKSLLKAFLILFKLYKPYFKAFLIALIAYFAYKIGRKSIADPFEKRVYDLQRKIKNSAYYVIQIPQKIKFVRKLKTAFIAVFVVCIIAIPLMIHYKIKLMNKFEKMILAQLGVLGFLCILALWGYQIWLQRLQKEGRNHNIALNQQLYATTKQIGPKAEGLIRTFLCKQKQLQKQKRPAGACWKQKCKQQRILQKDKAGLYEGLVQTAMTFEWCYICKTKLPFEEFLEYQSQRYESLSEGEQIQQVNRKNEYLMNQLLRMSAWVRGNSPCNCSRLYWMQEIRHIKGFKDAEIQLQLRKDIFNRKKLIYRR